MEIVYSEKSAKQLRKIVRSDKKTAQMIIEKIESLANSADTNFDIKTLRGRYGDLKRLRVGTYRIIFEIESLTIFVYEVKHRKEAYHD